MPAQKGWRLPGRADAMGRPCCCRRHAYGVVLRCVACAAVGAASGGQPRSTMHSLPALNPVQVWFRDPAPLLDQNPLAGAHPPAPMAFYRAPLPPSRRRRGALPLPRKHASRHPAGVRFRAGHPPFALYRAAQGAVPASRGPLTVAKRAACHPRPPAAAVGLPAALLGTARLLRRAWLRFRGEQAPPRGIAAPLG